MRSPVLIHAPLGDDAGAIAAQVEAAGETARICAGADDLGATIWAEGPEAALLCIVTEEGAGAATGEVLARAFASEPHWARLPLVFLGKDVGKPPPVVRQLDRKEHAPPFLVIDRPCRPAVLRHAIETQAEARRRQFDTRDLLASLQREEERGRYLLDELRHRTRNSLAVLQSLFAMSARQAGSVAELSDAFRARLQALSAAHTRLSEEGGDARRLAGLLREHVLPYAVSADQLCLWGPAVRLSGAITFDLAMVVHELATNAAKYVALSRPEGRVEIGWERDAEGDALPIVWRERGGPPVEPPEGTGLGSRLVRRFPMRRPAAQVSYTSAGLVWQGRVPADSFEMG